jgi:para-aminobenzoate synthetase/4-amino-4-deoxychorismate lyase
MLIHTAFENKIRTFSRPLHIITCTDPVNIGRAFDEMEAWLSRGYYLAGYLSYEAGHALEASLMTPAPGDFPLVRLGCFRSMTQGIPDHQQGRDFEVTRMALNIDRASYGRNIDRIRDHIAKGDVYQITYCWKHKFDFTGSPMALYDHLRRIQPVPYPAYIEDGPRTILSLSPELFIKKQRDRIITKPMKGTWPRGAGWLADMFAGWQLHHDPKNRAENVMIADLLRNDLGRVARQIRVPRLFEVDRYTTLYQMTSTVTGMIDLQVPVRDIFTALFPSGSVTGAPKIRAMGIIRDIEGEPRKIYTGAIGYITPQRDMFFNVPIRTILLDGGKGEMGVGGGIVWDSTADGEWAEGHLKANFLTSLA